MYLAFDTETTALPRPNLHPAHPLQPHLLQFAGIVLDEEGNEVERLSTLVKPGPGAILFPEAFRAHGISLEFARREGIEALDVFSWFSAKAQRAKFIIGHNVDFDVQVMMTVGARLTNQIWEPPCPLFCTMTRSSPLVNLPPTPRMLAARRYHPKPPTLSECVKHFFGEDYIDAHDATSDVQACVRIFRHLTIRRRVA